MLSSHLCGLFLFNAYLIQIDWFILDLMNFSKSLWTFINLFNSFVVWRPWSICKRRLLNVLNSIQFNSIQFNVDRVTDVAAGRKLATNRPASMMTRCSGSSAINRDRIFLSNECCRTVATLGHWPVSTMGMLAGYVVHIFRLIHTRWERLQKPDPRLPK